MKKTNFVGKPAKHGEYFIFHIPNKLIKAGKINPDITYEIFLSPLNIENSPEIEINQNKSQGVSS